MTGKREKSKHEWREALTSEQYRVLREEGTERSLSSPLNDEPRKGSFACAGCGQALFTSDMKFDSVPGIASKPFRFKSLAINFRSRSRIRRPRA